MVQFKRLLASALVSITLISNIGITFANTSAETPVSVEEIVSISNEQETNIDDLNVQLNDLYHEVGDALNINYIYVKMIHMVAGGKAVYADTLPNIYAEETVDSLSGSFDIDGASQSYEMRAPWVVCPDDTIKRPSKYYLPDAAYNVTASIVNIMNTRYTADRGILQDYFNALSNDVKTNILFCEAMLQYTGSSEESVNSFYSIYEKLIYDKESDENVIEATEDGQFKFKNRFEQIIRNNGISTDREIEILTTILQLDSKLAASCRTNEIYDEYIFPYKVDYTSRENMMLAAMSVVGKVRYVWGGGHLTTGNIDGINPTWEIFYDTYGTVEDEAGYDNCIRPNNGWCPLHETVNGGNGCLLISEQVNSVEEYIEVLSTQIDMSSIQIEKLKSVLKNVDFEDGVTSHRLDGLDCSGYASWLYNQITNKHEFDSGAIRFTRQAGITQLKAGSELKPGDVFSWGDHIIVIIGKVSDGSKAYVMIESGPNTVKFGVAHYSGASTEDIEIAKQIAIEANQLLGNINTEVENTRTFNMSSLTYQNSDNPLDPENGFQGFGRLKQAFLDENIVLTDYNKKLKDMNAVEIIQHTINNLPYQYISGIDSYEGELFTVEEIEKQLKDVTISTVVNDIVLTSELNQGVETIEEAPEQGTQE